jgi:hypothetical protein
LRCVPNEHAIEVASVQQFVPAHRRLRLGIVAVATDHQPGRAVDVDDGRVSPLWWSDHGGAIAIRAWSLRPIGFNQRFLPPFPQNGAIVTPA